MKKDLKVSRQSYQGHIDATVNGRVMLHSKVALATSRAHMRANLAKLFRHGSKVAPAGKPEVLYGEVVKTPTAQNPLMVVRRWKDGGLDTLHWENFEPYKQPAEAVASR